ncbi:MAG: ankyrin repeat domain-containing protein [Acidobacteria bacterium]|nr:ankyrin repeat domain-containing protein [Acidobacteriota bacterium]
METNEARDVVRTSRMWGIRTGTLAVLVLASSLVSGALSGSAAAKSGKKTPRGDLVYDACIEVHAKSIGEAMLPIVCRVMADDCMKNPGGDGCKNKLRPLDEGMKASGSSMLFAAAHAGRMDIVKTMVGIGSDPNGAVATGWTPLLIAAAEGHEETVAALLEIGADPNVKNQLGRTALMFASSKGFTAIVTDLLVRGADPNAVPTDDEGWTALMVAARAGHVATVKALLKSNARVGLSDKSGNTALALAEAEGHSNVARVLRGQGQEP